MEKVRSVLQGIVKRFLERQPEIEELSLREGDKILDALCTGLIREELLREDIVAKVSKMSDTSFGSSDSKTETILASSFNDLSIDTEPNRYSTGRNIFSQIPKQAPNNQQIDNKEEETQSTNIVSPRALFVHLEVLIIFNTDPNATGIRRIVDNEYEGVNKEISKMLELLQSDPTKCTNPVVDFSVRGTGDLVPVWFIDHDNEYVLSRDFYLTLIEDFLRQSKTPGALIWFVGSGEEETGNWCFRDGVIAFEDIFHSYENYFRHKLLYLLCDCPFSSQWIPRLAAILDQRGVPVCGHGADESGLQLKIWTPPESMKGLRCGTFVNMNLEINQSSKNLTLVGGKHKRLSGELNHFYDTTWIRCTNGFPYNNCGSKIGKVLKISDAVHYLSPLVHLVRGKDRGRPAWHYVLVEEGKINSFKEKTASGTVDVARYGKVLMSGWGEDPPKDIRKEIESLFAN